MYCQIQATPINNDNKEMNDYVDFGDVLDELIPSQQNPFYHQQYRRASLRYHPNVLYKKASLKPIIGQHGKVIFSTRDQD